MSYFPDNKNRAANPPVLSGREKKAMGATISKFGDALITEEIRAIVARAIKNQDMLSAADAARLVSRAYPNCGLSEFEIANQIMMAAARAGVAVEIGRARVATSKASNVNTTLPDRKAG